MYGLRTALCVVLLGWASSQTVPAVDLANYFHHPSKRPVGAAFLGARLATQQACIQACDSLGQPCAGFVQEVVGRQNGPSSGSTTCQLVAHGYGLASAAETDFYRRKKDVTSVKFDFHSGAATPSTVYDWYAVNGSDDEVKTLCAADSQCQGFYKCLGEAAETESTACNGNSNAAAMLVSAVPPVAALQPDANASLWAKASGTTCGGTAKAASCRFPFTAFGLEFFSCTTANAERPWCYTLKPGLWGFCDCGGQEGLGYQWETGPWGSCSASCGGGVQVRTVTCLKSADGTEAADDFCGQRPPTAQACGTSDCKTGCDADLANRKPCAAYYEDPLSQVDSIFSKRATCRNYGCCWAEQEKGVNCYLAAGSETSGCKHLADSVSSTATSAITKCGSQCCRGDSVEGSCAHAVGYASPADSDPCAAYKSSSASPTKWWKVGTGKRTDGCRFLRGGKEADVASCQAECGAELRCNSIHWHLQETICELLYCEKKNPPSMSDFLGWDVYVFAPGITYKWSVGPWSSCQNPTLAENNKHLTDSEKIGGCPQGDVEAFTDSYGTEVWRTQRNGARVDGYCYYLSREMESCTDTCARLGTKVSGDSNAYACNEAGTTAALPYNHTAKNTALAQRSCVQVLSAFGVPFSVGYNWEWQHGSKKAGCIMHDRVAKNGDSTEYDRYLRAFTNTASDGASCADISGESRHRRACACGTYVPPVAPSEPASPTKCNSMQNRTVKCIGSDGADAEEARCAASPKPEAQRTCWGTCGVQKSCEELAWETQDLEQFGSWHQYWYGEASVCGGGRLGGPFEMRGGAHATKFHGCWGALNHAEAAAKCAAVGARQCTLSELLGGNGGGLDCGHEAQSGWNTGIEGKTSNTNGPDFYWSSTPCPDENGTGYWVGWSFPNADKPKGCARPNETHLVTCCADFKTVDKDKWVDYYKSTMPALSPINGEVKHCDGQKYGCKVYEGHCKTSGDCRQGGWGAITFCARGAGAKYGLPEGSNVCIPMYDSAQVSFMPKFLWKERSTNILFTERGDVTLPEQAEARIIRGAVPGCMGVWDRTAKVVQEARLQKQSAWRMRPVGWPHKDFKGRCRYGQCFDDLPYDTEPFMEWRDVTISDHSPVADSEYTEPRFQVCLCDTATDCSAPMNWHDLGYLSVEPAQTWFAHQHLGIGRGGDLFETYSEMELGLFHKDLPAYRMDLESRWFILKEYCSQRCLKNPKCHGFDLASGHNRPYNWCYLRGEGVKVQKLEYSAYMYDYYTKMQTTRREWHYYPLLDWFATTPRSMINPQNFADAQRKPNTYAFMGLSQATLPGSVPMVEPNITHASLRPLINPKVYSELTGTSLSDYFHSPDGHSGDGKVFAYARSQGASRSSTSSGSGTNFAGGMYWAALTPTCGGNALGAPCHGPSYQDPDDSNLYIWNRCHLSDGGARPWCYTRSDYSRWGYCDCRGSGWTRYFASPNSYNPLTNLGAVQGDLVLLTDDLHRPITGITLRPASGNNWKRLGVDMSRCIRSESYKAAVSLTTGATVECPAGEVLTGFGLVDADGGSLSVTGITLRCGVPAGWTVQSSQASVTTPSDMETNSAEVSCNELNWDVKECFAQCSEGSVATGMVCSDSSCTKIQLVCNTTSSSESASVVNGEYRRLCSRVQCSGNLRVRTGLSAAECLAECDGDTKCSAVVVESGQCNLYSGTCPEATKPYGRPLANTSYTRPAIFSAVEVEHPTRVSDLMSFQVSSVPTDAFVRVGSFVWAATPWSGCSKDCGTGQQTRTVFCAPGANATFANAVAESRCNAASKISDLQYCNMFHCDDECRVDVGRSSCSIYEQGTRKNSHLAEVRRVACEEAGCCFVARPPNNNSLEPECYAKPFVLKQDWLALPWEACSASCTVATAEDLPTQTRRVLCVRTDGSPQLPNMCPSMEERPVGRQTCNGDVTCPTCTSPCGYGVCESYYTPGQTWRADARCSCLKGYGGSNFSQELGRGIECANDLTSQCSWSTGAWSTCTAQPWSGTASQTRDVVCQCPSLSLSGDGKLKNAQSVDAALEFPTSFCDGIAKPQTMKSCTFCSCGSLPSLAGSTQTFCDGLEARLSCSDNFSGGDTTINCVNGAWVAPTNVSCVQAPQQRRTALDSNYVVLEYRQVNGGSGKAFRSTLSACVASCKGQTDCPAAVFLPDANVADGGSCQLLSKFTMAQAPVQRGPGHLIVRRGVFSTLPQPGLLAAAQAATAWTDQLGDTLIAANEVHTKLTGTTAAEDTIWDWMKSVSKSKTAQGVSFKKSLFSLSFPVHPNVVRHLRYLKRFFSADKDAEALSDWLLAAAVSNRHLSSVSNSTSSGISQSRESELLTKECKYAGHVFATQEKRNGVLVQGQIKMPAKRDLNPSPLGAMSYLLRSNASLLFPVVGAPWPLMAHLATQFFPARECDWVWSRYKATPDGPASAIRNDTSKRELMTRWAFYGSGYFDTKVRCKESAWNPDALPRISEDGGLCGRLAYVHIGRHSCAGQPAGMLGQPKHASAFRFVAEPDGRYTMRKYSWIAGPYDTTHFGWALPTDEVAGLKKHRETSVDYVQSLEHGMNLGLNSWLNSRLALILYRVLYSQEGVSIVGTVATLLLSALETNPHLPEAWDLLVTHIETGVIQTTSIVARVQSAFKPVASVYPFTFGNLIQALSIRYECTSNFRDHLEKEIAAVAGPAAPSQGCDKVLNPKLRLRMLPCLAQTVSAPSKLLEHFEPDLIALAWEDCQTNSNSPTLTQLDKPDMPAEYFGFEAIMAALLGPAKDSENYGVAGTEDQTGAISFLEALLAKLPVGQVMKLPDFGTNDFVGTWETAGRVMERMAHKSTRQVLAKFYNRRGLYSKMADLESRTFARLMDPVKLQSEGRLMYSVSNLKAFKTWAQTHGPNGGSVLAFTGLRRLSTITPDARRLAAVAGEFIDGTVATNLREDASTGQGVKGAEGRLQKQSAYNTEDQIVMESTFATQVLNLEDDSSTSSAPSPSPSPTSSSPSSSPSPTSSSSSPSPSPSPAGVVSGKFAVAVTNLQAILNSTTAREAFKDALKTGLAAAAGNGVTASMVNIALSTTTTSRRLSAGSLVVGYSISLPSNVTVSASTVAASLNAQNTSQLQDKVKTALVTAAERAPILANVDATSVSILAIAGPASPSPAPTAASPAVTPAILDPSGVSSNSQKRSFCAVILLLMSAQVP